MLRRIKDLDERINTGKIVEWQSSGGVRYRWERAMQRVGVEHVSDSMGSMAWDWISNDAKDLRAARRVVFDAINEDEF